MRTNRRWTDTFLGHRVYSPTAGSNIGHNWLIADTSSSGTPTYVPSATGRGVTLTHDNTNEAQNVCLYWGDKLGLDIDDILEARFRLKMSQTALNAASSLAFGLATARNDAIDSLASHASFRVIGGDSTTAVVVETDDGTIDKDDKATGQTLINVEKDFLISFALGKRDVRFFIGGQPVALDTTFDMSNFATGMQPYLQLQKTAATPTDGVTLSLVDIVFREGVSA